MIIKDKNNFNLSLANDITAGIIGSLDFQRRLSAALFNVSDKLSTFHATPSDAWKDILEQRPDCVFVEIGVNHDQTDQTCLKTLCLQLRDRFEREIFIAAVLSAPEKLFFGGDLLFESDSSLSPSHLIDTFLAIPPPTSTDIPSLKVQALQTISMLDRELTRRDQGGMPIPALASEDWVFSMADPASRELWMLWLPRYASYTNENPIITGPTGAGKTRLAKAIHTLSGVSGPFVSITPRDFSSSELIQAELFGAVAGAYTGAVDKWGILKTAENGTLFIDELQSIDKDLQGKLITFIENKTYRRVGSAETIESNVRFIFATNRNIQQLVEEDVLRDDFAYRLERVNLEIPPLKERKLDIASALAYSLAKIRRQRPQTNTVYGINSEGYRILFNYSWPGNLRQLENSVAQLCELADIEGKSIIDEQTVIAAFKTRMNIKPSLVCEIVSAAAEQLAVSSLQERISSIDEGIVSLKNHIRTTALDAAGGDKAKAAEMIKESENIYRLFEYSRISNNIS